MVERVSYKKFFLVFGLLFGFITCLGYVFYVNFTQKEKQYYVYFKSSVNGLKEGSVVTYKGVEVGRVYSIRIELPEADTVKVTLKLKENFPVYSNYRAMLSMRGFSGYHTIDLSKDLSKKQVLLESESEIPSEPSGLQTLYETLPELVIEVKLFIEKLNKAIQLSDLRKAKRLILKSVKSLELTSRSALNTAEDMNIHMNVIGSRVSSMLLLLRKFEVKLEEDYDLLRGKIAPRCQLLLAVLEEFFGKLSVKMKKKSGIFKWII